MRWSARAVLSLAIVGALVAITQAAVGSSGRSHTAARGASAFVTVSSMSEPPDRRNRGTTFSIAFTVSNQGRAGAKGRSRVRFYLTRRAGRPRRRDVRLRGSSRIGALSAEQDASRRIRVRIPRRTPLRLWFLVACVRSAGASSAAERSRCAVSGQRVRILPRVRGTTGGPSLPAQFRIERRVLPIGRATITGGAGLGKGSTGFGDAEKSNQRVVLAQTNHVTLVGDCKRTTNGDNGGDPNTTPVNGGQFDQDGDEAKVLVYGRDGNVTFNSLGGSARKNIPAGEGSTTAPKDTNPSGKQQESIGGEGKHMAIAAARDPQQSAPQDDWVTAYRVGTIYITHSSGEELIFTGYAGIDVFGIGNQCAFGGVLTAVKI